MCGYVQPYGFTASIHNLYGLYGIFMEFIRYSINSLYNSYMLKYAGSVIPGSSMILLLSPLSSQLNPLSDFLSLSISCLCQNTSVCVSSQPIDLSFITLGKVKTLISLSLKVNKQLYHFNYFRKIN